MSSIDITFKEWKALDKVKAQKYSEELQSRLAQPIVFDGLKTSYYANQKIFLAQFRYKDSLFSLIPGGEIYLGFDPSKFTPSQKQRESFQQTAQDYDIEGDIYTLLQKLTTPLRLVELPTILVETHPQEIGLEWIDVNEPEIQKLLKQYPNGVEVHKQYRINKRDDGSITAWKINFKTHRNIVKELFSEGLRLLTNDEWEYVCGAGLQSLFRWGNDCPCDRYPIDNTVDEIRRKKEWVLSGGKIPFTPDSPDWNLHLIPNLFGLSIAKNPYEVEIVAQENTIRGGDGGCNICGGVGFFFGWLPLATSYLDLNSSEWLDEDLSNCFFRRVITLSI